MYEKMLDEVTFSQEQYMHHLFASSADPRPEVFIAESEKTHEPVGIALFIPILHSTIPLEDLSSNLLPRTRLWDIAVLPSSPTSRYERKTGTPMDMFGLESVFPGLL